MLGLVLRLNPKNLDIVRKQLIDIISHSTDDSKFYLYEEDSLFRNIGEAVGAVSNYKQKKFELKDGLKKAMNVLDGELFGEDKVIYIITDKICDRDYGYFELLLKKYYMTDCKVAVITSCFYEGAIKVMVSDFTNIAEIINGKC